jgi:hypothetical protein
MFLLSSQNSSAPLYVSESGFTGVLRAAKDLKKVLAPLNFHPSPTGLQYAVSIDDKWVANNINIQISVHNIQKAGKHTYKFWVVNSGIVLQKIVLDFSGKTKLLRPTRNQILIKSKNKHDSEIFISFSNCSHHRSGYYQLWQ